MSLLASVNSADDLVQLFDEVQLSKRCHKSHNKKLHTFCSKLSEEEQGRITMILFRSILDQALIYPKSSVFVDRTLEFIAVYFAQSAEELQSALIEHAAQRIVSTNKLVRQRVCDMLAIFLSYAAEQQISLSVSALERMSSLLTTRLSDKIGAVRLGAVKALRFLQDAEDPSDPVVVALLSLLSRDPLASVRKAIVESLALCEATKAALAQRVLDIKPEVRAAVLTRFIDETDVRQLPKELRLLLVQRALQERDTALPRLAERLLLRWLSLLNNDVAKFLAYFSSPEQGEVLLLVGTALCEACQASSASHARDAQEAASIAALQSYRFPWDSLVGSRAPAPRVAACALTWLYLRLSHARATLPTIHFLNLCEECLPDVQVFVHAVHTARGLRHVAEGVEMYKALALLAPFCAQCVDAIAQRQLEAVAWEAMQTDADYVHLWMRLVQQVVLPNPPTTSAWQGLMHSVFSNAQTADGLATQLALVHWSLTHPVLGTRVVQQHAEKVRESVLEGLQSPQVDERELAMQVLGAYCVQATTSRRAEAASAGPPPLPQDEAVTFFVGLAKHVAESSIEVSTVRIQAVHVIVDLCLLSREVVSAQDVTLLLRTLWSAESELFSVALEGAIKLVFNGCLDSPEIAHRLATQPCAPCSRSQQLLALYQATCLASGTDAAAATQRESSSESDSEDEVE